MRDDERKAHALAWALLVRTLRLPTALLAARWDLRQSLFQPMITLPNSIKGKFYYPLNFLAMGSANPIFEPVSADIQAMQLFMGLLAHEIRSQIADIWTTSEALVKGKEIDKDMQVFHYVQIEAISHGLLQIFDNMTDNTKFSQGKLELQPVNIRFHFRDWLRSFIPSLGFTEAAKGVSIEISINDNVPENIVADAIKLEQVLRNLINNAYKFAPEDTSIGLIANLDSGNRLFFEVTDQGQGIAADKLHLLFQPLQQLEKGKAGTGLGLFISKLLVNAMGGDIEAYNQNKGNTFSFYIPIV